MPMLEDHTASFIVRIWRELGSSGSVSQEWRGSIEHVQSGRRSFFRDFSALTDFIRPDLEELGIEAPLRFWETMERELSESAATDPAEEPSPSRPRRINKRTR